MRTSISTAIVSMRPRWRPLETSLGGAIEGSVQAAAVAFICGATAGGCALIFGIGAVGTAAAVHEGGFEALIPKDPKGWGQLTGFGIFGGFGPVSRTAEAGSSAWGAIRNAFSVSPARPHFSGPKPMVVQAKAPLGAGGLSRCATCSKEFGPWAKGIPRPWDIDHIVPWRYLKYLVPQVVERLLPGARKWLYNLDINLRLRCQACNRG